MNEILSRTWELCNERDVSCPYISSVKRSDCRRDTSREAQQSFSGRGDGSLQFESRDNRTGLPACIYVYVINPNIAHLSKEAFRKALWNHSTTPYCIASREISFHARKRLILSTLPAGTIIRLRRTPDRTEEDTRCAWHFAISFRAKGCAERGRLKEEEMERARRFGLVEQNFEMGFSVISSARQLLAPAPEETHWG